MHTIRSSYFKVLLSLFSSAAVLVQALPGQEQLPPLPGVVEGPHWSETGAYPAPSQIVYPANLVDYQEWGDKEAGDSVELRQQVEKCGDTKTCDAACEHHGLSFFAELLYLRPGNIDVAFAQEVTGPDPDNDSPTGPMGLAQLGFETGFRGGLRWAVSDCSSIAATYTWYDTDVTDSITANPGLVLKSLVTYPSSDSVGAGSIMASSQYGLQMQLVDLDYQRAIWRDCYSSLNYVLGIRYANLDQEFAAEQNIFAGAGLTTVATDITFEGMGIRLGLNGQRRSEATGLLIYAKANANAVTGNAKAIYRQTNQFGGTAVIGNDFEDFRTVTMLDAELGVGWVSPCERWRITTGYLTSYWFNTLTTRSYIDGVRGGSFGDLSETMTLTGLTARVEFTY